MTKNKNKNKRLIAVYDGVWYEADIKERHLNSNSTVNFKLKHVDFSKRYSFQNLVSLKWRIDGAITTVDLLTENRVDEQPTAGAVETRCSALERPLWWCPKVRFGRHISSRKVKNSPSSQSSQSAKADVTNIPIVEKDCTECFESSNCIPESLEDSTECCSTECRIASMDEMTEAAMTLATLCIPITFTTESDKM